MSFYYTRRCFAIAITMKKLPKSVRKFIRKQKAQIRRSVLDSVKQEELIKELYNRFNKDILKQKK